MTDEKFVPPPATTEQAVAFVEKLDLPGIVLGMVSNSIASELRQIILDRLQLADMDAVRREFEARTILVPSLSAAELVAKAKQEIDTTYLDEAYLTWDFMKDEAGKRYEVMTYAFNRDVTTDEVRKHFKDLGFVGNTAAFIAWVTKQKPDNYLASFSDDDRMFHGHQSDMLCAPAFCIGDGYRRFELLRTGQDWGDHWTFVAFREIPQK